MPKTLKILFLTQYFPPETGAPQNRIYSLARNLSQLGAEITILTAIPSYPKSEVYDGYKGKWFVKEQDGDIKIQRCPIFISKSGSVISRLLNYFSFVFSSFLTGMFYLRRREIIICESPPLFLGIAALLLKWFKRSKLVFNVSDLWPLTAEELGIVTNKTLLSVSYSLERFIYQQSSLVSGQTQGIINNIRERFPKTPLILLRNGIDLEQFDKEGDRKTTRAKFGFGEDDFVIAYAGIIGHAQGFDVLLDAAEKLNSEKKIKFLLVGDGPVKDYLISEATSRNLNQIIFSKSIPRSQMPDIIAACDCYVTPLRKNKLFLGAIPSKIFEPLLYGKPVIMGVDGEARSLFADEGNCALYFEPENSTSLVEAVYRFYNDRAFMAKLGENGRHFVKNKFDRKQLALQFWERLKQI